MITVSAAMMQIPFDEFKAFIEKVHPGLDAAGLWVANGGTLPKEKKSTGKEKDVPQ